jgi:nitroreductase
MVLKWCEENNNSTELIKLSKKGTDLLMCHAPCVIIGWCPEDSLNPCVDTAIAMETVELLLCSEGLATCWGGYLTRISNSDPELKALLGVPDGSRVYCCLMTGYADREKYPNIPYRPPVEANWLE